MVYAERGIAVESAAALWTAAGMPIDVVPAHSPSSIPRDADRVRLVRANSLDHDGRRVCAHTESPPFSEFMPTVISLDESCIGADATLHDMAAHEFGHYLGIPQDHHLPPSMIGMMAVEAYWPEMADHPLTCSDVRDACLFTGCDPRGFCDAQETLEETHVAEPR